MTILSNDFDFTSAAIMNLRPDTEWVMHDNDINSIEWITPNVEPVTVEDVLAEVQRIEAKIVSDAEAKAAARTALLEKLGITEDEAAILKGGL